MIILSGVLVVVAIALLVAGIVAGTGDSAQVFGLDALVVIYVSIAVSIVSAVCLAIGVFLRRKELFGPGAAQPAAKRRGPARRRGAPAHAGPPPGSRTPPVPPPPVPHEAGAPADPADDEVTIPAQPADVPDGALVFVVRGRKRYHLDTCRQLAGRDAEELTYAEAKEEGFSPCTACMPDTALAARAAVSVAASPAADRSAGGPAPVSLGKPATAPFPPPATPPSLDKATGPGAAPPPVWPSPAASTADPTVTDLPVQGAPRDVLSAAEPPAAADGGSETPAATERSAAAASAPDGPSRDSDDPYAPYRRPAPAPAAQDDPLAPFPAPGSEPQAAAEPEPAAQDRTREDPLAPFPPAVPAAPDGDATATSDLGAPAVPSSEGPGAASARDEPFAPFGPRASAEAPAERDPSLADRTSAPEGDTTVTRDLSATAVPSQERPDASHAPFEPRVSAAAGAPAEPTTAEASVPPASAETGAAAEPAPEAFAPFGPRGSEGPTASPESSREEAEADGGPASDEASEPLGAPVPAQSGARDDAFAPLEPRASTTSAEAGEVGEVGEAAPERPGTAAEPAPDQVPASSVAAEPSHGVPDAPEDTSEKSATAEAFDPFGPRASTEPEAAAEPARDEAPAVDEPDAPAEGSAHEGSDARSDASAETADAPSAGVSAPEDPLAPFPPAAGGEPVDSPAPAAPEQQAPEQQAPEQQASEVRAAGDGGAATGDGPQVRILSGTKRYHRIDCALIEDIGDEAEDLEALSRDEAKARGCTPCLVCRPDDE